jgi:hypothetical protein
VLIVANLYILSLSGPCGKQYLAYTNTLAKDTTVKSNIIIVSGIGYTYAKPDQALVTIGVRTESTNAQEAQQQNAEKMKSVMDSLKANNIAEDDIKTTSYRLDPIMRYDEKTPVLVGYQAENIVQVTLKDITKVGKIIDVSVAAGANIIQNIQFSTSKDRLNELRNNAISAAVQDARQKAETTAKSLGVTLIEPIEVTLIPGYEPRPLVYEMKSAETPIIPGELEVSVSIQVTYSFN